MPEKKPLIIVTGASSGIGAATARMFSAAGHPLLLLARRQEKLTDLNLPDCLCVRQDVNDGEGFRQAVQVAEKEFGPADCLVNNAGIMLLGEIAGQNPGEWKKMLDLNVMGLLNGIHTVLQEMTERKAGTIINIGSVAGRKTFPNHAVYCGTKFAVHALTEGIRAEVSDKNVRIVTIAPGAVETELLSHTSNASIRENYEHWKNSMGGAIAPDDVARSVLFAYSQPQNVCIREIVLAATKQEQ